MNSEIFITLPSVLLTLQRFLSSTGFKEENTTEKRKKKKKEKKREREIQKDKLTCG